MSYQVLARKWRPRFFDEMVGQEHVLRALINALNEGRLHHAYLFTGTRGVGKTTMACEVFAEKFGGDWLYFSASTMDPWVDFVGVPKEMKDSKGAYLELVRPKQFRDDKVKGIIFDEFNRSHPKVRPCFRWAWQ